MDGGDIDHGLPQVGVDPTPEGHPVHQGAEAVVEKDEIRRLARHVGPSPSHGDADLGRLERGRVVDSVAGHGHDLPVGLEGVDQGQLLFGTDAREDPDLRQPRAKRLRRQGVDIGPGQNAPRKIDARLAGDRPRRRRIVARDHRHRDARPLRDAQRGGNIGSKRVLEGDQPEEAKAGALRLAVKRTRSAPARHRQHA
ncbi:hypothetical protein D3C72_398860 [compost metagenome]